MRLSGAEKYFLDACLVKRAHGSRYGIRRARADQDHTTYQSGPIKEMSFWTSLGKFISPLWILHIKIPATHSLTQPFALSTSLILTINTENATCPTNVSLWTSSRTSLGPFRLVRALSFSQVAYLCSPPPRRNFECCPWRTSCPLV